MGLKTETAEDICILHIPLQKKRIQKIPLWTRKPKPRHLVGLGVKIKRDKIDRFYFPSPLGVGRGGGNLIVGEVGMVQS